MDNQSLGPIGGTFEGLPEGAILLTPVGEFQITYVGGNGNDIVISLVPEPTTGAVVVFFTAAAVLRRRREPMRGCIVLKSRRCG